MRIDQRLDHVSNRADRSDQHDDLEQAALLRLGHRFDWCKVLATRDTAKPSDFVLCFGLLRRNARAMIRPVRLLFLALPASVAVAVACSSSASNEANTAGAGGISCSDPSSPKTYELGTGEACFERLTAGQTIPVMNGPQGGYHLWTAIGCSDCGATANVRYGVKDPMTQTYWVGPQTQVVMLSAHGWPQHAGLTAFLPGISWDPMSGALPKGTHVILNAAIINDDNTVKHEQEIEVVLGDTVIWDPCDPSPMTCGQPGSQPCCTG